MLKTIPMNSLGAALQTSEVTESDVIEVVKKLLKPLPKWKELENKRNLQNGTHAANLPENLNLKTCYWILGIHHFNTCYYRNVAR